MASLLVVASLYLHALQNCGFGSEHTALTSESPIQGSRAPSSGPRHVSLEIRWVWAPSLRSGDFLQLQPRFRLVLQLLMFL